MEKKKWVKLAGFAMVFLLSLFLCVGCADSSAEDLTSVEFNIKERSSRVLYPKYEQIVAPEMCYWTYVAEYMEEISGTVPEVVGESEKDRNGRFKERPVSAYTGISGTQRKFTKGKWKISVFGYTDKEYAKLVYTASKEATFSGTFASVLFNLKEVTLSGGVTVTSTDFASQAEKSYPEKARLDIGTMVLSVPYGHKLIAETGIKVEVYKGSDKIASGYTSIADNDINAGEILVLAPFVFEEGKEFFTEGEHNLTFRISCAETPEYLYAGTYKSIGTLECNVSLLKGVKTTISGSLCFDWEEPVLNRVGGRIYYDAGLNGAMYRFYDRNGNEIEYDGNVDRLANAYYYSVTNRLDAMKDRFYVVDSTNYCVNNGSAVIQYGANGTQLGVTYAGYGLGKGREARDLVLSKGESVLKDTSGGYNTIWSYIKYINGQSTNTSSTYMYLQQLPGGCDDWYIPTVEDLCQLGKWSTVLYENTSSTPASNYYTKYTYNSSAVRPSQDECKALVWDIFKGRNYIFSCNEADGNDPVTYIIEWSGGASPNGFLKCGKTAGSMTAIAVRSF